MESQQIKLQLFNNEEKIVTPLVDILNQVTISDTNFDSKEIKPSIKKSLDELFPEQAYEEKTIKKAKEILGDSANEFTDEELKDTVVEIQFLANSWLDDFERKIFDGITLKELLHEKGGTT